MKTSVYLVLKYWRKHKKNLFALIFSGVILTVLVFVILMLRREDGVRALERNRCGVGAYDIIVYNSNDEILEKITENKTDYKYGYIDIIGKLGTTESQFYCGVLHDEKNLWHPPIMEGRMPETADEIAIGISAAKAIFWTGKSGDSITLDDETYTVTGIIDDEYNYNRYGLHGYMEGDPLPRFFVGASEKQPVCRVDMLGDYYTTELLPGMDESLKAYDGKTAYEGLLTPLVEDNYDAWILFNEDFDYRFYFYDSSFSLGPNTQFTLFIAAIGVAVAVLSVFSAMRSIFAERAAWMQTLRRIGAGRGVTARFYAVEGAFFTVLQTVLGLIVGLAAYGGIFAYKVNVLGEKKISGFSTEPIIASHTQDPFLYAVLYSLAVFVPAYLLCVLTSKIKAKKLGKSKKPRTLSRCFGRMFSQGGVTVVQTAALTLICFSVVSGYLYYTRDNKDIVFGTCLTTPGEVIDYTAGGVDLNKEGIAEYYYCTVPMTTRHGHMDLDNTQWFSFIDPDETKGFYDDTVEKLPDGTVSTGEMGYLFFDSDEPVSAYGKEIDLSDEILREHFLLACAEEYQNFFDEGQLGSKHLYQAPTRLADAGTIKNRLSEYVIDGEINIAAINAGEEVIVAYNAARPPFPVGSKITLHMTTAYDQGYGIGNIVSKEVTIGALVRIPQSAPEVLQVAALCPERKYNFLTTSTGAAAMGAPSCSYSDAYAYEEVTGAPFPLSAEASVIRLKDLKHKVFVDTMRKAGSIVLIFAIMCTLGFSAYFNGIGMKIRTKKYEISVARAVGAPVSAIRKRLMIGSLKIPLTASVISYGLLRIWQFVTKILAVWYTEQFPIILEMHNDGYNDPALYAQAEALSDKIETVRHHFFLDYFMWEPSALLPTIILFAALCVITFAITAAALKKFRRDIAFDLGEERTRQ